MKSTGGRLLVFQSGKLRNSFLHILLKSTIWCNTVHRKYTIGAPTIKHRNYNDQLNVKNKIVLTLSSTQNFYLRNEIFRYEWIFHTAFQILLCSLPKCTTWDIEEFPSRSLHSDVMQTSLVNNLTALLHLKYDLLEPQKRLRIIVHSSLAIEQLRSKWLIVSPLIFTHTTPIYNHDMVFPQIIYC